jgi:hypothetical protein
MRVLSQKRAGLALELLTKSIAFFTPEECDAYSKWPIKQCAPEECHVYCWKRRAEILSGR